MSFLDCLELERIYQVRYAQGGDLYFSLAHAVPPSIQIDPIISHICQYLRLQLEPDKNPVFQIILRVSKVRSGFGFVCYICTASGNLWPSTLL